MSSEAAAPQQWAAPCLVFNLVVPLEHCVQGKGAQSMTSLGQNQQVPEIGVSKAKFQRILTAQS